MAPLNVDTLFTELDTPHQHIHDAIEQLLDLVVLRTAARNPSRLTTADRNRYIEIASIPDMASDIARVEQASEQKMSFDQTILVPQAERVRRLMQRYAWDSGQLDQLMRQFGATHSAQTIRAARRMIGG